MLGIEFTKDFRWFSDLDSFYDFIYTLKTDEPEPVMCFIGDPEKDKVELCRFDHQVTHDSQISPKICCVVEIDGLAEWFEMSSDLTEIIILKKGGEILGWMETVRLLTHFYRQERSHHKRLRREMDQMNLDIQSIFDTAFDYVTDGNGITLRVSSASEKLWGYKAEELIGRSVYDLEKERVFYPSASRLVLDNNEKVSIVQKTRTGRKLLVWGIPIHDEEGRIIRVVNGSRDITELERLKNELDETKMLLVRYKEQLDEAVPFNNEKLVYQSHAMEMLMSQAKRVADVDSTVLITGESGVGKEGVAEYIHQNSNRNERAFIKINCGSIPENLIESELFGYEKGAFTGALKEGKIGLIEAADKGTLFLDEIGDLPMNVQVKLLRVLQSRELTRVGGTVPIQVDIRIIAATHKDLVHLIDQGLFREDLYYRLNIIPLYIPPLRERSEDIIPLIYHFLNMFNKMYHRNKHLSGQAMEILVRAPWKGNIRELKNTIERLIVLTEKDLIVPADLPQHVIQQSGSNLEDVIEVKDILPLKTAKMLLERKLIDIAAKKYSTMTEIAHVLEVNQSTISRIYKKGHANTHNDHAIMHNQLKSVKNQIL